LPVEAQEEDEWSEYYVWNKAQYLFELVQNSGGVKKEAENNNIMQF
jgi:hypothetical protein